MFAGGHRLGMAVWALLTATPVGAQETAAGSETVAVPGTAVMPGTAIVPLSEPRVAASEHRGLAPRVRPGSASALLAPVQGSDALRPLRAEPVAHAVRQALVSRGHHVTAQQERSELPLVDCSTPECVEHTLDGAGADYAIVPAVWSRPNGADELTLTMVRRVGRSLNVSGVLGDDLLATATVLIDTLLAQRAASAAFPPTGGTFPQYAEVAQRFGQPAHSEPVHPNAWKAGPVVLIAAGAAASVAVGVAAGLKTEDQQLNAAAVGAWSAVGAAAIAGGVAWWVVGKQRRRPSHALQRARGAAVGFQPTRIDFRLRF